MFIDADTIYAAHRSRGKSGKYLFQPICNVEQRISHCSFSDKPVCSDKENIKIIFNTENPRTLDPTAVYKCLVLTFKTMSRNSNFSIKEK